MRMSSDTPSFRDAEEAFSSGDFETSLIICEGLFHADEADTPTEILHLAAESLLSLQEPGEAAHLARVALSAADDEPALHHCLGVSSFELGEFVDAQHHFERAIGLDPELGEPLFYLAMIAERQDQMDRAAKLYIEAVQRDPESLVVPTDWSPEVIKQVFNEVVEEMPAPFGIWLAGLTIDIQDLPSDEALSSDDGSISPLVHCLFSGGVPQQPEGSEPERWLTQDPEAVTLFRLNLGKSAHDQYELHRDLLEAILWEAMDFLGLDDSHLLALGLLQEEEDEPLHPVDPEQA